jgi:uncharacterized protein
MPKSDYMAFFALDPFFDVVMAGLSNFVEGEHYFDTLADDVLVEFLYEFPGWPRVTRGRANLIALYSGYGGNIRLDRGDALAVHPSGDGRVVTLEYEVHGRLTCTLTVACEYFIHGILNSSCDLRRGPRWAVSGTRSCLAGHSGDRRRAKSRW